MATPPGQPGDRHDASASKTSLSDRELLGEIDHASTRDRAPEAWLLAATRDAPEQLEQDLLGKSDQLGLPIVVIDWKPDTFPALAALCTAAPEILDERVGKDARPGKGAGIEWGKPTGPADARDGSMALGF